MCSHLPEPTCDKENAGNSAAGQDGNTDGGDTSDNDDADCCSCCLSDASDGVDWQDEDDYGEAEASGKRIRVLHAKRVVSKRTKARAGTVAMERAAAAARRGSKLAFSRTLERVTSKDRHGKGGQAKLTAKWGRSVPRCTRLQVSQCHRGRCQSNGDGVIEEGMVLECATGMQFLLDGAVSCKCNARELLASGRSIPASGQPVYKLAALKRYLVARAFHLDGNPRVHLQCLAVSTSCKFDIIRVSRCDPFF